MSGQGPPPDLREAIVAVLPRLRRFCMALARDADAGDDLCQATVERALAKAGQFQPGTRIDSWMYRIAQNLAIDGHRRRATHGVAVDIADRPDLAGDDGVALLERRSELARARQAMAGLPDDQRAVMALVVLDGKSYAEAADILAVPLGTVMSRLARARRAVASALAGGTAND